MTGDKSRNYWALLATPRTYRVEDAVSDGQTDLWTVGRSRVQSGDRVIVWKAKGRDRRRGVVALGEVLTDPLPRPDHSNQYWTDRSEAAKVQTRVEVRYVLSPRLPLWLGDPGSEVLEDLSVSRARGGTVFKVTPEQWDAVAAAVGGWPAERDRATP